MSELDHAGLDFEIVEVDDREDAPWQVWTPGYPGGACIGLGLTEHAARADAIRGMERLCEVLMGAKA